MKLSTELLEFTGEFLKEIVGFEFRFRTSYSKTENILPF